MASSEGHLRVAFPFSHDLSSYDPAKIHFGSQYILLENIYSPLVEISPSGDLISGVAKRFEWIGNEAVFEIRDGLKTASGYQVTAHDAEFSLKRLLVLSQHTHGNFGQLLCNDTVLKSADDFCEGIEVRGNTLVLKTPKKSPFLFPMLASIDFAVIPKVAVDQKTLKIIDFKNTSGPYYINTVEDGKIALKANPSHYHYSGDIAHTISLATSNSLDSQWSLQQFKSGNVDFITTIDRIPAQSVAEHAKSVGANLHKTIGIKVYMLVFTKKGVDHFNRTERIAVAKLIRDIFKKYVDQTPDMLDQIDQIIPAFGEGSLNSDEEQFVVDMFNSAGQFSRKATLGILSRHQSEIKKIVLPHLPEQLKIVSMKTAPAFTSDSDTDFVVPDMFIVPSDMGFLEDISLLTYSLNEGLFCSDKVGSSDWLDTYMNTDEKRDRLAMLRKLHFDTIKNACTIPLMHAPFVALSSKGWHVGLSKFYANNQLWLVTRN